MALVGTVENQGRRQVHTGIAGVNDNDIVIETNDISNYDVFELKTDAGAADVVVDIGDGTFVGPHSMADLGATTDAPVVVTAAGRLYGWRGNFRKIRVQQNGLTGATGAILRCYRAD